MGYEVLYDHFPHHVRVVVRGDLPFEEFLAMLRQAGADSVRWSASCAVFDLRGIVTPYSFTEQLRIGESVARNLGHLRKVAAVATPERVTRVGEKAAVHSGARVQVFDDEADALAWLLT